MSDGYEPVDTGDPDMNRLLNYAAADADESPPVWWWLSFTDPEVAAATPEAEQVPGGRSFLGVVIVQAPNMVMAVARAHDLGINPGGQVAGVPIPDEYVPASLFRDRLLSKAELDAAGLA